MNFNFKLRSGGNLRVHLNTFVKDVNKGHYGVVTWNCSKKSNEYKEAYAYLKKDDLDRYYFNYNGEAVYMDTFIALTPEQFVEKIYSDEYFSPDELTWTLMKYGIDSIRVIQPKKPMSGFNVGGAFFGFESYRKGEDKSQWDKVEYKLEETDIHKLVDNYKIRLRPVLDEHIGVYASRDYYISDLVSLLAKCKDDYQIKLNNVA